jgi:hypothetical protein
MVAEDEAGITNVLPVMITGWGLLDGPMRYTLSGTVNPPSYVPGAIKIQMGSERGVGNVTETVVT